MSGALKDQDLKILDFTTMLPGPMTGGERGNIGDFRVRAQRRGNGDRNGLWFSQKKQIQMFIGPAAFLRVTQTPLAVSITMPPPTLYITRTMISNALRILWWKSS
jgi:hypothetical protein